MSKKNLGKKIEKIMGKIGTIQNEQNNESSTDESGDSSNISQDSEKIYLKALSLHSFEEVKNIKQEVKSGNILIIKISPLAEKGIIEVKQAVNEIRKFVEINKGDLARLGEERIVVTPSAVKIWRSRK
jgi:SepF-like predicted cell division protein (DUF552 family)